ncbi:MAG: hypothetical protein K2G33_09815 [Duncaniella sp.]|nr:hypothetical protein [Duncaniella sp.]
MIKTTHTKACSRNRNLPISRKAYAGFTARLHSTFIDSALGTETSYNEALALLNSYLEGNSDSMTGVSPEVQIAFSMLRAEIDKAIARSSAARRRASLRKATGNNKAKAQISQPEISNNDISPITEQTVSTDESTAMKEHSAPSPQSAPVRSIPVYYDIPIIMNRSERRAYERELSRQQRRNRNQNITL